MRTLLLAAALLTVAGCDTDGIDRACAIGSQPAFERNVVTVRLASPAGGDTLRLGEPFRLRGRLEATGPDITSVAFRLQVTRQPPLGGRSTLETVLSFPLDGGLGVTEIDRSFTLGRLRDGITSADLDRGETLTIGLFGSIRFPVESVGPGCGRVTSGRDVGVGRPVTILNGRPAL